MKKFVYLACGIFIVLISVFLSSFSIHAEPKEGQKFGDWTINCFDNGSKNKTCFLTQYVTATQNNESKSLAIYQIGYAKNQKDLTLIETVPLGVNLTAGTAITVNSAELIAKAPYSQCTVNGCQSIIQLSDADFKKIINSTSIALNVIDYNSGSQSNIPFSNKGLSDGIKALKK
ncbi:MAG: invasion associated locus B family protein [Rickettsiaceae bacterium]